MQPTRLPKFKTTTSVMGISSNVLFIAAALEAPLAYIINTSMDAVLGIVLIGVLYWYVFLKFTEWLVEMIPPKFFAHLTEWVRAGSQLYVTNDSSPLPMSVPDTALESSSAPRQSPARAQPQRIT